MEFGRSNNRRGEKRTLVEIVGEAVRKEEYCPHVKNPLKPVLLAGDHPSQMLKKLESMAEDAKDSTGKRKLRKDARILMAGVMSYPERTAEMKDPIKDKKFMAWCKDNRQWLERHYGTSFRSAIIHLDESHPHIHFYVHEDLDENGSLGLSSVHPGLKAEKELKLKKGKAKVKKADREKVFSEALEKFQHDYWIQVSHDHGMKQHTEKRRRLKNDEFKKKKAEEAKKVEKQDSLTKEVKDLYKLVNNKNETINSLHVQIETKDRQISKLQKMINKLEGALVKMCQKTKTNAQQLIRTLTYNL